MKETIKYNTELEEKLMYMDDEELFCFFEKYAVDYEEKDFLKVVLRSKDEV